jgi:FkbM family methyltransferase
MRWLPAAGGKVLRVISGNYETDQVAAFISTIRPGDTVFDVGAAHGYYTLLSAKLVGPAGRVVAFEPSPQNAAYLRAHVQRNRLSNVTIRPEAISDFVGELRFQIGMGSGTGRIDQHGSLTVPALTLDQAVAELGCVPQALKIDVEGAELTVLAGARTLLQSFPTLFLSTHGTVTHQRCCRYLQDLGYHMSPLNAAELAQATEILAVSPRIATAQPAIRAVA